MENQNVFAGAFVDRSGERRKDPDWLAEAASSINSRFVPVWGDKCLVGGDPPGALKLLPERVIDDMDQLKASVRGLLSLDIDTILVGDGVPIMEGASAPLQALVETF